MPSSEASLRTSTRSPTTPCTIRTALLRSRSLITTASATRPTTQVPATSDSTTSSPHRTTHRLSSRSCRRTTASNNPGTGLGPPVVASSELLQDKSAETLAPSTRMLTPSTRHRTTWPPSQHSPVILLAPSSRAYRRTRTPRCTRSYIRRRRSRTRIGPTIRMESSETSTWARSMTRTCCRTRTSTMKSMG